MAKLRRTLLIGLGGTGVKAILDAKKMFYENYGEIPPMIGFLGVDTDKPGLSNNFVTANDGTKINLNTSEQLCISVETPADIYANGKEINLYDWMPNSNVQGLSALSIGAGQMRSNGRFAITVNESNVEAFVNNKINEINNAHIIDNPKYGLLSSDTEVHMVFSLGGGTGSGTFLNMAYLIKRLFPTIKLSGYAVLSDVFRNMATGAMTARVKPNAMGAIIDLDYLAHLTPNSEKVKVKWFRSTDEVNKRPFDALYFVDNKNENNDVFAHVDSLCEMIALAIVTSVGELGVELASVSDNVSKLIADGTMDIKNKSAWVAGFGCAEIFFNGGKLAKIYEHKALAQLVNKMLNGGCDDPGIIANNWFDANKIRENHDKDNVIDYFMAPTPPYIFSDIDDLSNPEPECRHYVANQGMDKQTDLDAKLAALQNRVKDSLNALMAEQANRECGIFLCQQILTALLREVELCDGEMKAEKEKLDDEMPGRDSSLKMACKELADCMDSLLKFGKKDKAEEVVNQTMVLARTSREIKRREMARQFYAWLTAQLNKEMESVDIIMKNLQTIRNKANTSVQDILRSTGGCSFFQFDLSTNYATRVDCPIADIVFNDFARAMENQGGIIALKDLNSLETESALRQFVGTLPQGGRYAAMGVDDALNHLSDEELTDLIRRAIQKSLPLLPYHYRGYDAELRERPVECYYVGVANKATSRLCKDNLLGNIVPNAKDIQFSEIGLNNRVIIYRQLGVIPAFAVKAIDGYRADYESWEANKPFGSHWDKTLCERMKAERYRLDPKAIVDQQKCWETWIHAIVFNLISYDAASGKYQIKSRGMGGKALKNWLVDMGADRKKAFQYMEDNIDVLEPELRKAIVDMDKPGPDNPVRVLVEKAISACKANTYLQEVSHCPISLENIEHYPAEEEMIEKEMEYILDKLGQ
ncbi:MAG: tubulin-like doman-containing protein [Sodaliphilus sp.]